MPKDLAVILPTFRERENLGIVVDRVTPLLEGLDWELIFVDDDSDDGSKEELLRLAGESPRVRFLIRIARRGLASACIDGMCSTDAELLAVMDADLQHDETVLSAMVSALREDASLDLAVGTRYAEKGGMGRWPVARQRISRMATALEKFLLPTNLSDPMSGFFVIRREAFQSAVRRTTGEGFKILLDLVLSSPRPFKIREFPYTFRPRENGASKLDIVVSLEFFYLLADKLIGWMVPVRFVFYVLVGLTGVALHLVLLRTFLYVAGWEFVPAQWAATLAAMVSNFLINNSVTFRSSRLKGPALIPGAALYVVICAFGALANVQVAGYLFGEGIPWWFAGTVGAGIGAVWNYAVSTQVVWTWFPRQSLRLRKPVSGGVSE